MRRLLLAIGLLMLYGCDYCPAQTVTGMTLYNVSVLPTILPGGNDIVPVNRLIDWSPASVGVIGGVPDTSSWPTSAVMNSGTSVASIQSALDNAASNSIVLLNGPTNNSIFTVNAELFHRTSYVSLKGSNPSNVILQAASPLAANMGSGVEVCIGSFDTWNNANSGYATSAYSNNWTAGFNQGNTVIYVAANSTTQQLAVGMILGFDQLDDNVNIITPNEGSQGNWVRGPLRSLQEFKRVTKVVSNQVTFTPGLYSPYWSAANTPAIFWPDTNATHYVQGAGIENLTIDGAGIPKYNLNFGGSYNCWAKNITVKGNANVANGGALFGSSYSMNFEVRHSLFTGQYNPGHGAGNYVMLAANSANFRVEDNVVTNYYNALLTFGCIAYVESFNYFNNDLDIFTSGNGGCQCSGPTANFAGHSDQVFFSLVEGNYARYKEYFNLQGIETYGVCFRNRFTGWEKASDQGYRAIRLMENSWYASIVGNILGTVGFTTAYEGPFAGESTGINGQLGNEVYCYAGTNGSFSIGSGDARFNDPKLTNTLFRAGNWDSVNQSQMWVNASSQPIANSLTYASKPAWYPHSLTWPPFDPTVPTLTPVNLPAYQRYLNGGVDAP